MAFRVGIVGLGMAVAPHAKSLQDLKVEVAYAYSPTAARRTQFAQRFPFPQTESLEKMEGRIRCDLDYLRNWSLQLDLLIIAKTVRLVFKDASAY